jgi:hypothetical protein
VVKDKHRHKHQNDNDAKGPNAGPTVVVLAVTHGNDAAESSNGENHNQRRNEPSAKIWVSLL